MIVAGLAAAGAAGALLRYLVDHQVQHRLASRFPIGILVVNLSGSLGLGVLVGLGLHHGISSTVLTVVGTGLIGSYTTFSTFAFETVRLVEDGQRATSVLNVAVSMAAGVASAAAGLALGSLG